MSFERPKKVLAEKPGFYWVIGYVPSESDPGKSYEIRTSMRDGRTYCNCRGWYQSLQPHWRGTPGVCKHMEVFLRKNRQVALQAPHEAEKVTLYDLESWAAAKRTAVTDGAKKVSDKLSVRRPGM